MSNPIGDLSLLTPDDTPVPSSIDPRVYRALPPSLWHMDPWFRDGMDETRPAAPIFQTENRVTFPLSSSGSRH